MEDKTKDKQTLLYNMWYFAENNLAAFAEEYEEREEEEFNESQFYKLLEWMEKM